MLLHKIYCDKQTNANKKGTHHWFQTASSTFFCMHPSIFNVLRMHTGAVLANKIAIQTYYFFHKILISRINTLQWHLGACAHKSRSDYKQSPTAAIMK